MAADAHAEFEKQVLRIMAALYKSHPRTINLGWDTTLVPCPDENDLDFEERITSSDGTILLLYRSGLVTGNLAQGIHHAILDAQLSSRAYSILRKKDNADPSLGQAAVRAAGEPGSKEESVVAGLIVGLLF
jgi:hypothetical protein